MSLHYCWVVMALMDSRMLGPQKWIECGECYACRCRRMEKRPTVAYMMCKFLRPPNDRLDQTLLNLLHTISYVPFDLSDLSSSFQVITRPFAEKTLIVYNVNVRIDRFFFIFSLY